MGYMLNSLGSLPVDEEVSFYKFVVDGGWHDPATATISGNFGAIARSIGDAVITKGLDRRN